MGYLLRRPIATTLFTTAVMAASLLGVAPASALQTAPTAAATRSRPATYSNPLDLRLPGGGQAASCADPTVLKGRAGDRHWYLYCTTDALRDTAPKELHFVPQYRSTDLIHWKYAGDAFTTRPSWLKDDAGVWAPEVVHRNGKYYMYYTASDTKAGGSAIGLAISSHPTGPWADTGVQVVPPTAHSNGSGDKRWEFDPEVLTTGGKSYIYFGSYFGGIFVRRLSADGKHSIASTEKRIAIDNRYEGTVIVKRGGWFYFMGSASNCCNGQLTGYSVFAARSRSPLGPFRDKDGRSILATKVGGTPVLSQNGNRWVGTGHNAVLRDYAGQYWTVYHAVNQFDPYYSAQVGYTKRPALIDPLDWRGGWPVVRGDRGPSTGPRPGPAAQPGQRAAYHPHFVSQAKPGGRIGSLSDEFSGTSLSSKWTWIRKPDSSTYSVSGSSLTWEAQQKDLQPAPGTSESDSSLAAVLAEQAPKGDYVLDTKVHMSTPSTGDSYNYVQGGLIVYRNAANYVRLTSNSIFNTRQTEFGKHVSPKAGYPAYGNGVVGPVGYWTYLRIVKHTVSGRESYTAYTSLDGRHWDKGITWNHHLGAHAKIGLISLGAPKDTHLTARFAYLHVSRLRH